VGITGDTSTTAAVTDSGAVQDSNVDTIEDAQLALTESAEAVEDDDTIHVFSLATGHMYERLVRSAPDVVCAVLMCSMRRVFTAHCSWSDLCSAVLVRWFACRFLFSTCATDNAVRNSC
jgi:hypothetical protein